MPEPTYQIKGMYLRKEEEQGGGFKQGTDQKQHDQKKNKTNFFFAVSVCLSVGLFDNRLF